MKKEFEIYQDNKGNVYTITTELEQLLLEDLVELYSIIQEVREYIEEHTENIDRGYYYEDYVETYPILEILDKEGK